MRKIWQLNSVKFSVKSKQTKKYLCAVAGTFGIVVKNVTITLKK